MFAQAGGDRTDLGDPLSLRESLKEPDLPIKGCMPGQGLEMSLKCHRCASVISPS